MDLPLWAKTTLLCKHFVHKTAMALSFQLLASRSPLPALHILQLNTSRYMQGCTLGLLIPSSNMLPQTQSPTAIASCCSRKHSLMASGGAASVAAGRVAYAFGLRGAAAAVDTACSSSLVTAHMAAREMAAGAAERALAAGISLTLGAGQTAAFSVTGGPI